jgi:D-alanyl-lipoteichoic acid acyltransferase DltB (MBOAT superfamily)
VNFTDVPFLILLVATYALWLLVRRRERVAVALLVSASLLFYGHNHWRLLPILFGYCVVDWGVGIWIERTSRKRLALGLGVGFNLVVLCFYKYVPMLVTTFASLSGVWLWPEERLTAQSWSIPFGISFYAFTGIAYVVDVYRRTYPAERNFIRYALSAIFFPHLVAGPILRAHEFLSFVRPGQMPTQGQAHLEAAWLIARGYFKKQVLASRVSGLVDPFFAYVNSPVTDGVWSLPYVYLYALQIYLDFSAYTDIARGIGLLFGYRWPDNFNWPYVASSVSEFWQRWHVTLSRFLRDYLYIPLGGNRHGLWHTCLNLMITMLLGGLWHGASWSFLLWGGLHGAFLISHRLWCETPLSKRTSQLRGPLAWLWRGFAVFLTFHCVCLAWCFFRLTVLSDSLTCVRKWVEFDVDKMLPPTLLDPSLLVLVAGYVIVSLVVAGVDRWVKSEAFAAGCRWGLRGAMLALAVLLAPGGAAPPFIYFQF